MFCIQCGQQLDEDAKFCFSCGAETIEEEIPQVPENIPVTPTPMPVPESKPKPNTGTAPVIKPQQIKEYASPPEDIAKDNTSSRRIIIIVSVIAVIAVIAVAVLFFTNRERGYDEASALSGAEGQVPEIDVQGEVSLYHIDRVVTGYLPSHPGVAIGQAFNSYFYDFEWNHFLDGSINTVTFFGRMTVDGVSVPVQIYFRFTEDDADFSTTLFFRGGLIQEAAALQRLLDSVFANAG